jgi:hypothetical protein
VAHFPKVVKSGQFASDLQQYNSKKRDAVPAQLRGFLFHILHRIWLDAGEGVAALLLRFTLGLLRRRWGRGNAH